MVYTSYMAWGTPHMEMYLAPMSVSHLRTPLTEQPLLVTGLLLALCLACSVPGTLRVSLTLSSHVVWCSLATVQAESEDNPRTSALGPADLGGTHDSLVCLAPFHSLLPCPVRGASASSWALCYLPPPSSTWSRLLTCSACGWMCVPGHSVCSAPRTYLQSIGALMLNGDCGTGPLGPWAWHKSPSLSTGHRLQWT